VEVTTRTPWFRLQKLLIQRSHSSLLGGYWESGNARGRYRVVVKTHCREHCGEEVILEQLDETVHGGGVRRRIPVPETAPMGVENVNFWPTGRWTGAIEFLLHDDRGKNASRLCLTVTGENTKVRQGSCQR